MKFLLVSIFLHLVLIFKFFHYENIHAKSNEEKVISVSINDFSKKSESQIKKAKINNSKEDEHLLEEKNYKSLENKESLQENVLDKNMIPSKDTDVIIKNENKQLEIEEKSIEIEKKDYVVSDFNKGIVTEEIVSTYSKSVGSNTISANSSNVGMNAISKGNTEGVSSEGNLSSGEEFIAKNQDIEGLKYNIISSSDPEYPIVAKKANYKNTVVIKVRFLVNGEGKIEEIKFYDNETKFGFHEEVENSLKKWKFSPPKLNGKSVKMYFYKSFVFKLNQ